MSCYFSRPRPKAPNQTTKSTNCKAPLFSISLDIKHSANQTSANPTSSTAYASGNLQFDNHSSTEPIKVPARFELSVWLREKNSMIGVPPRSYTYPVDAKFDNCFSTRASPEPTRADLLSTESFKCKFDYSIFRRLAARSNVNYNPIFHMPNSTRSSLTYEFDHPIFHRPNSSRPDRSASMVKMSSSRKPDCNYTGNRDIDINRGAECDAEQSESVYTIHNAYIYSANWNPLHRP